MAARENSELEEGVESTEEDAGKCSILAPSKFGNSTTSSNPKLSFPGLKASKLENSMVSSINSTNQFAKKNMNDSSFVPLNSEQTKISEIKNINDKIESSCNFVFGQNLKSRAENFTQEITEESKSTENKKEEKYSVDNKDDVNEKSKTLTESAAEYCEAHLAGKRKYQDYNEEVVTGEENETNILQIAGKLHNFDKSSKTGSSCWVERGRGIIRLNDMSNSSRLIMRSTGVLKVILNTKLFPGMSIELATEKSLRFTGSEEDGSTIKIFLFSGGAKDVSRLHDALCLRLDKINNSHKKPKF